MGNYNPVYKSIWTSKHFNQLASEEKLVYLYLLTNRLTSQLGICSIKPLYIAGDCGLSEATIVKILNKLHKNKMIALWSKENLIFIHKFFKYSKGIIRNPTILAKVLCREYELLDNVRLWELFTVEYNQEIHEILRKLESNLNKSNTKEEAKEEIQTAIDGINKLINGTLIKH